MAEEVEDEGAILKEIRDLLLKERKEKEEIYEVLYPPQGGTKTITAGTTEINLYTGEVFLEDSEEKVSQSLRSYGVEYAHSLFISTNKAIVIQLDDRGKYTISANRRFLRNYIPPFQRITITATEDTTIKMIVSTDPRTMIFSIS